MLAAVFQHEMLLAARRRRDHFLRWVYAALLLTLVPALTPLGNPGPHGAAYVQAFTDFLNLHLACLLLLTPALAAGAITDEKTSGTLIGLLTSNLRPAEIVLGKTAARATQAFAVALAGLPLAAFFGTLGSGAPWFAPALLAVSAVVVVAVASVSLLASVWCRRTRDAVLVTYLALAAGFGLALALRWTRWAWLAADLDPWRAMALDDPPEIGRRLGRFTVAWMVPAAITALLACWRLRPAYLRQLRATGRARPRWWQAARPRVRGNPVAWRERCVLGIAPAAWMRTLPRWPGVALVALASAAGFAWLTYRALPPGTTLADLTLDPWLHVHPMIDDDAALAVVRTHGLTALLLLTLLVAIRASGSIAEERERATWDGLLLTPISTRQIVRGKFWGILRAGLPYLAAYAVGTVPLSWLIGLPAVFDALAVVAALFFAAAWVAAIGVYCSACLRQSWRSLLLTLAASYVGGAVILAPVGSAAGATVGCFLLVLQFIDRLAGGGAGPDKVFGYIVGCSMLLAAGTVAWCFVWNTLRWAEDRINKHERTKVLKGAYDFLIHGTMRRIEERERARELEAIARHQATIPLAEDE